MIVFRSDCRLAAALRRRGWLVFEWDSSRGDLWDLSRPAVARLLRAWLRSGLVWGMYIAAPFAEVQLPVAEEVSLSKGDSRQKVRRELSRSLVKLCVSLVLDCRLVRVPVVLSCESSSGLWKLPKVRALEKLTYTFVADADSCLYGCPWRFRRRLQGHRVQVHDLEAVCEGHRCARTGHPHHRLAGRAPSGVRWSSIALEEPAQLSDRLALAFECARKQTDAMVMAPFWGV